MSNLRTDKLQLAYDRGIGDAIDAEDNNSIALYLENTVANVLLSKLIGNGLIQRDEPTAEVDPTTGRIGVPEQGAAIAGMLDGKAILMSHELEYTGTVTEGTTQYLIDSNADGQNGHWVGAFIIFTSGALDGQVVQVTEWGQAQHKFAWDTPLVSAPTPSDTYIVTFFYVQDYTLDTTNYVFATELPGTARHGKVQWVARTTSDSDITSLLVASVDLDASGNITAIDNSPAGNAKTVWGRLGSVDTVVVEEDINWTTVGSTSTRLTIPHDRFLARYSVEVELSDAGCSYVVAEGTHPERTVIDVDKDAGTNNLIDVTVTIRGRLDTTI